MEKKDLPKRELALFLSSSWNRRGGFQDHHGCGLVQQDVGAEAIGFVGSRILEQHLCNGSCGSGWLVLVLPDTGFATA